MKAVRVLLYHWNSMHDKWAPTLGEVHVEYSQYKYPFWKGKRVLTEEEFEEHQ